MKATSEQIQQFASDITATIRRVLGLTAVETTRPGWYRPSALTGAKRDAILTATRPVITAFARRYAR